MGIDLDKVITEEQGRDPYTFTFDGETYTLPPSMDVRAVAAIAAGRLDDGLRILLNPEQWQRLQDSPKVLPVAALEKLFEDYAAYNGVESLGKSSGSTP